MNNIKRKNFIRSSDYWGFLVILLSLFAAIILSILPLSPWMSCLWPLWTILILIFWAAYLPEIMSLWGVWVIGLLVDVLQGSLLGEHALSFVLVFFMASSMNRQIKAFPLWHQTTKIAMILGVYQLSILLIERVPFKDTFLFFLPVLTSLILWPWILFLMRGIAVRFYIHRM